MKMHAIVPLALLLQCTLCCAQTNQTVEDIADKDVIAVVLGKKVTVKDKDKLNELIFGALLDNFAKENRIEPTKEELDIFLLKTEEIAKQSQVKFEQDREKLLKELKSSTLSDQERKAKDSQLHTIERILKAKREEEEQTKGVEEQLRPMKREMAHQFVQTWKVNKALYAKYGGRVIFQQAGVEPLDAYRDFLEEQEKKGSFQILDKKYEAPFRNYFTNDTMHMFYKNDDGAKFINTPWWLMETPPNK